MLRALAFLGLLILLSKPSFCQLNCQVIVNSERAQTTEKRVFEDMQNAFRQFLNDQSWTSDIFNREEKIGCNLLITIESQTSITSFNATVQVQAARPIYDSNYESILLNFADRDWQFEYTESQPLFFNDNQYMSNLTSMLAYYAYIIIGLDYDSFGKMGGSPHIEKAWNVVTNAQQSNQSGWTQLSSNRNRYWLAENLLNPQMSPIREGMYAYHRLGMDIFQDKPDEARKSIVKVLKDIQDVNKIKPNSILVISFFDAKREELLQIFSKGDMSVRQQAYEALKDLDPSKTDKYQQILNN